MNVQYISDNKGVTTGVFIPISEWNELKSKFKGLEEVESDNIPEWHKDIVLSRLSAFEMKSEESIDFETAMDAIDKGLDVQG